MNHNTTNEPHANGRPPTTAHFHYTSRSTLTLPIVSLVAIIGACVAGYAWFSGVNARVEGVDARVDKNTRDIEQLQRMRDALIRIDENVKLMRAEFAAMRKEGR